MAFDATVQSSNNDAMVNDELAEEIEFDDSTLRAETPKSSKSSESKIGRKRAAPPLDVVDSAIVQFLASKKEKC
uniref:Uncharacterized protein n=1 Tax=Romanomermis culicivorax TaxID=13658 RepID=A0A915IFZ7_ROMCU